MSPERIRYLGLGLFALLIMAMGLVGAQKHEVAHWTAEARVGSSGPFALAAGIVYRVEATDGCGSFPSQPAFVEVVNSSTGQSVWDDTPRFSRTRGSCNLRAFSREFQVTQDGAYWVNWSIPPEVLPYHTQFMLNAPVPGAYLWGLFLAALLAGGASWTWAWAVEVWERNAAVARQAADEQRRLAHLEKIQPPPDAIGKEEVPRTSSTAIEVFRR